MALPSLRVAVTWFREWIKNHTIQAALITVVGGIVAVIIGVELTERYRARSEEHLAVPSRPAPPTPSQQSQPERLTGGSAAAALSRGEGARADLRQHGRLRGLESEENDHPISRAPRGVFGFADVAEVRFYPITNVRLHAATEPLRATGEVEVHNMADGSVRLVGFVSREVALALRAPVRNKSTRLTLYNAAWASADYLVSVALSEIANIQDIRRIQTGEPETRVVQAFDVVLH